MSRSKRRPSFPELERVREARRAATASLAERQGAALGREAREQLGPLIKAESRVRAVDSSLADLTDSMRRAADSYLNRLWTATSFYPPINFPTPNFRHVESPPSVNASKLSALKEAAPYKVERPAPVTVPDMVECITAWRAWGVQGAGDYARLDALGRDALWQPRAAMQAVCLRRSWMSLGGGYSLEHAAPAMDCNCGVWAFKELDGLVAALGSTYQNVKVIGRVSLWGKVVETENGYRAQYAYPSELWLLDDSLEELGLVYDVPVRMIRSAS